MNVAADKGQQFGKYALVERLGRGGMAEVWKAKISGPQGFSRTLVVKRILPHLVEDPHFVQMFVAEARLSARLNHTNIVQVFELGEIGSEFFLAMEYVRGRDLVNVVRAQLLKGPPPPGLGAFCMREVCRALAYAHALTDERGQPLQLIHRDVSPSNVMISFDGAVKLLDFGIAKALSEANENKTVTGTLKGKFGYMSPEQVEGKEIDHRADLFAAGVVLHEVLTGKRLFKGQSDLQTIAMVRDAKVERPSLFNPAVSKELDDICLKALAKNPDDRWRGCDEMAVALDDVVHGMKWGPERLATMLRELFPDEPSHSSVVSMAASETIPQSGLTIGALRRHELKRRVAVGAAALAVVGGVAWLISAKALKRPVEHAPAPVAAKAGGAPVAGAPGASAGAPVAGAPSAAAAVPAPEKSPTVTLRVISTPAGADVYLGDERTSRGKTPLALTMARDDAATRLTVRMKGYEAQASEVVPDSDSRLQMTLTKVAPSRPAASGRPQKRPSKSKPATPAAPKAPVPDLHRGDVVDPFAR